MEKKSRLELDLADDKLGRCKRSVTRGGAFVAEALWWRAEVGLRGSMATPSPSGGEQSCY